MTTSLTRSLILASGSIYRRELLARLRLPFEVCASSVSEAPRTGETPVQLALRLSLDKANSVAGRNPQALVIGSDQVAELAGRALGKPASHARAVAQLQAMRGHSVVFHTAVSLVCLDSAFARTELVQVRVKFRDLTDAQIDAYLHAEQPYDCAASAKSEGLGIVLLERIDSDDPTALIGLPLIRTSQLLEAAGVKLL